MEKNNKWYYTKMKKISIVKDLIIQELYYHNFDIDYIKSTYKNGKFSSCDVEKNKENITWEESNIIYHIKNNFNYDEKIIKKSIIYLLEERYLMYWKTTRYVTFATKGKQHVFNEKSFEYDYDNIRTQKYTLYFTFIAVIVALFTVFYNENTSKSILPTSNLPQTTIMIKNIIK